MDDTELDLVEQMICERVAPLQERIQELEKALYHPLLSAFLRHTELTNNAGKKDWRVLNEKSRRG